MGKATAKVRKITRTIFVLEDEALDEASAFSEYFNNCEAELHKLHDVVEEGTNESFGTNLGWDEDDE